MRNIQFVETLPEKEYLYAFIGKSNDFRIPKSVEIFLDKSRKTFHSFIFANQEYLFVKENDFLKLNKKAKEDLGASFAKAIKEREGNILLDLKGEGIESFDFLTGFLLAEWSFDKYKTQKSTTQNELIVLVNDSSVFKKFDVLKAEVLAVNYARDLIAEPANVLYPMAFAERLKDLSPLGIGVEILDKNALDEIGMTALLAVAKGSENLPAVAILRWNGADHAKTNVALVGKGVCFDSGGLCLKQPKYQLEMKWDKAGAGVVAGVLKALALLKLPVNVVGVLGLVENMPDGKSLKPGDIIPTLSGQTVEIIDTDAEGRLVLADCITYVQKHFQPETLIDLGTLTQETFASLGTAFAGLYSRDEELTDKLKAAGERSLDRLWHLPMGDYFAKQIESDVADMKNMGEEHWGENGAAAEFLSRYVTVKKWAHLDIAGVSWTKDKVITGFGVRLLIDFIKDQL